MRSKKGRNFKEVIQEEKNKGKTRRKIMKAITRLDSSAMYGLAFLATFVALDAVLYALFAPGVFAWAGILLATAVVSSLVSARVTSRLKKQQWKFASV